jgi:hypothetical protein
MKPHCEIPFICSETRADRACTDLDNFLLYNLLKLLLSTSKGSEGSQYECQEDVGDLVRLRTYCLSGFSTS